MTVRKISAARSNFTALTVSCVLAAAMLLGSAAGTRAEGEPASSAGGGASQSSGSEQIPPVTPVPEQKGEQPTAPVTAAPLPSEAYSLPAVGLSVNSFGGGLQADQPILVPRSGGLPTVDFTNKSPNWINFSMGLAESYDNNVFLRSNKQEDFITRISPVLGFNFQNQYVDWNLGSSLDYRYYARGTRTDDFSYALNTAGKITLLRDYAYLIISDQYSQISRSNATNYAAVSSNVNTTDLNVLRINPKLEIPLTSRIKFNPQYSYTNYWYPSQSIQNRESQQASADFSYDLSGSFKPYVGYNYTRMTGNGTVITYNQNNYTQYYPYIGFNYQDDRLTLKAMAGYSHIEPARNLYPWLSNTTNALIWNVNLTYRLSTMSFTFVTSSDVDQTAYQNDVSANLQNSAPQIVTSYTGTFVKQLQNFTLSQSLYLRENDNSRTSDLITRYFGVSGSLRQEFGPRLIGTFQYRVERNDQLGNSTNLYYSPVTHRIIYDLGYNLAYTFGKDFTLTGSYLYQNSSSPTTAEYQFLYSTYNYTDNRLMLELRKIF